MLQERSRYRPRYRKRGDYFSNDEEEEREREAAEEAQRMYEEGEGFLDFHDNVEAPMDIQEREELMSDYRSFEDY